MERNGRLDARLGLGSFALLLIVGLWVLTWMQLGRARDDVLRDAGRDAGSLTRVFGEHALRTIEAADQAAVYLRQRYLAEGKSLDLGREMRQGLLAAPLYNLLTVVDEHGDVVLSSKAFAPMNLSDRRHVQVHRDSDDDQLYISAPVQGRVSGKWSLQLTRRISGPDGSYRGVVVVSMDPQYFTRLYHDVDVGSNGAISLTGIDGVIRVRRASSGDGLGMDTSASALFAAMRSEGHGTITTNSMVDGRRRIYAFARLEHYPLYVAVGIDERERLQSFEGMRAEMVGLALLATLVIVACVAGIWTLIGRLVASHERIMAADRAKSRFLSNMSHELRTPLNGVLGYAELLIGELGDSTLGKHARVIKACGERQLTLVESVLELSALDAGQSTVDTAADKVRDIAALALQRQAGYAAERRLTLELEVDPRVPESMLCDRGKLLRVLDRLLANAIAHSDRGSVKLLVAPADGGIHFAVSDSGCGVPREMHEHVFERFFQMDDSPSRSRDGAGLGLALAAALVKLMGGRMTLRSDPGHGATFSFALPLQGA